MQHQSTSSAYGAEIAFAFNKNIPTPLTSLIGREQEISTVCSLLRQRNARLLTLTGTGGVGKTRLALHVATNLLDDFSDGVYFVPLVSIREPQFVIPTIAKVLNVQESTDQPLLERLITALAGKRLLLILDNFEQVMSAALLLFSLLEACPLLKVLVTSREVLRVRGEQEFEVPLLALPDLQHITTCEALSEVAAIALFVQRAQAVKPDFQLTPANAQVIAEICIRLDGLPLALELAVARLKLLSLQALLARLQHRLQVLNKGSREVAERQQTLFNTLQWSYELLTHEEQCLFRSLAVFVGGWTLSAAEGICVASGNQTMDVENGLASLIDKSLVQQRIQSDGELRFSLLETIREYAFYCLERHTEKEEIRQAHATYYLALAEKIEPELDGPQQTERLDQLGLEHDNLRAAMQWALEQAEAGQHGNDFSLQLGGVLRIFWTVRCYWSEGRTFLVRALAASAGSVSSMRAKALWTAAGLAKQQDDLAQAKLLAEEALVLYRQLDDSHGITRSLFLLGSIAANSCDYEAARSLTEEALTLAKQGNDWTLTGRLLANLGQIVCNQGDYVRAHKLYEESLKFQKQRGNKEGIAWSLFKLAWIHIASLGNPETAHTFIKESLAFARELNDKEIIVYCLVCSGHLAFGQDDIGLARLLLEESLALARDIGDLWATVEILCVLAKVAFVQEEYSKAYTLCKESLKGAKHIGNDLLLASALERLGSIVAVEGEVTWAAQLWGAAEKLRETMGTPLPLHERSFYERTIAEARTMLAEQAFATAWSQGRTMSPEQAFPSDTPLTFPGVVVPASQIPFLTAPPPLSYSVGLTKREVEVLRLVAQGLTNTQIAEQLILSSHTVNSHVRSILSKLGVTSRSAIIHFAFEHHLV